jgi:DNA-binding transcriptional MerR regulator
MAAGLTVGDFSRATHLSVKTLRHYHQAGLLEPAAVNPDTGYRYYSAGQVPAAQVIRRLRDLEMPVADVKAVLARRTRPPQRPHRRAPGPTGGRAGPSSAPTPPVLTAALVGYLEWGTRLAMHNSQPGADVVQQALVPRWGWGVASPYQDQASNLHLPPGTLKPRRPRGRPRPSRSPGGGLHY